MNKHVGTSKDREERSKEGKDQATQQQVGACRLEQGHPILNLILLCCCDLNLHLSPHNLYNKAGCTH